MLGKARGLVWPYDLLRSPTRLEGRRGYPGGGTKDRGKFRGWAVIVQKAPRKSSSGSKYRGTGLALYLVC